MTEDICHSYYVDSADTSHSLNHSVFDESVDDTGYPVCSSVFICHDAMVSSVPT